MRSKKKIEKLREIAAQKIEACAAAENAINASVAAAFAAQEALVVAEAELEKAAIATIVEIVTMPPSGDLAHLREMLEKICQKVQDNRKMREDASKMFGGE